MTTISQDAYEAACTANMDAGRLALRSAGFVWTNGAWRHPDDGRACRVVADDKGYTFAEPFAGPGRTVDTLDQLRTIDARTVALQVAAGADPTWGEGSTAGRRACPACGEELKSPAKLSPEARSHWDRHLADAMRASLRD
jgi:hypothetical protein